MNPPKGKVKFAIIGSGAIAEESYLPAAELTSNVIISHLVDQDIERAKAVAERFQIPNYASDYQEIFGKVDGVVVATPLDSHAKITIDCLNNGLHVLCEKPLAVSVGQAKEMVEASKRTRTHLGVGMVRRLSWSAQILRKLIALDLLGNIHQFDIEEGWEFNWPLRTGHLFRNENSRGILADIGTHLFDLIFWILGTQHAEVMRCKNDNLGGTEANVLIDLAVKNSSQRSTGRIEMSFTRRLRNTMKFYGERGCLEAETVGANEVFFYPSSQNNEPLTLRQKDSRPIKKNEEFVLQLSNFAASVIDGSINYTPADEVIANISLIEECYNSGKPIVQPWERKHLETFLGENR